MPPPSPFIIAAGIATFTAALMFLLMAMPAAASAADSPPSMDATKSASIAVQDAESASDDEIAPQRRRRGIIAGLFALIVANWEISLIIGGIIAFAILIINIINHHSAKEHPDE